MSAHRSRRGVLLGSLCLALVSWGAPLARAEGDVAVPAPLEPWKPWVLWDMTDRACPSPWMDASQRLCFWPNRLQADVKAAGAQMEFSVTVFDETWVPLPGGKGIWPQEVRVDGIVVPVVEREERPSVRLTPGAHRVVGVYAWSELPQRLSLPPEIGILNLTLEGAPVEQPTWDAEGHLWLRRDESAAAADKDFLAVKLYALVEDGIPVWWRSEIELVVSGKSREEEIGFVLPEGWTPAFVAAPIPVALDESGRMRAQVRAGKWTVKVDAFRLSHPAQIQFAAATPPAVAEALVGFRSRPEFRMVELTGLLPVDASQTTFPEAWRSLPVYRWETGVPFDLVERMRGMGQQKPEGLKVERALWLDEDGKGLTFRDRLTGTMQQIWRLDASPAQDLGSVRSGGVGYLITRNPATGASGVELRNRSVDLDAVGRMTRARDLPASGWQAPADSVQVTLNLPPGWRLFALWGADWVRGDWLTAWTLLDLFLLLVFALAVIRWWGWFAGCIAFAAFGLSYHEPGAPRYVWLLLLMPLALLRAVTPTGWAQRLLTVWKWVFLLALVGVLTPFVARQIQSVIFPQLEQGARSSLRGAFDGVSASLAGAAAPMEAQQDASGEGWVEGKAYGYPSSVSRSQAAKTQNLMQDVKARIQTGPGVPEWTWRVVHFGWSGPVAAEQKVTPVLIPTAVERVLGLLRVALVLSLAALLLRHRRVPTVPSAPKAAVLCLGLLLAAGAMPARAEFPDPVLLDTLKERLTEPPDAFPHAAEIPSVAMKLQERRLVMEVEVHVAAPCAVPLPGRLPSWSPLGVSVNEQAEPVLRRGDGYLWLALTQGVHRVQVQGLLGEATEWEWTFLLRPRRVTIDAPGWNVSGVRPDGVPEAQVFFVRQQKTEASEAAYDRQDFQAIASVERTLELGLIWQTRTTVQRLSPPGKAIALRVPLLPGENVLTSNMVVKDGALEARLGANQGSLSWESELPMTDRLSLETRAEDVWVERWELQASPVWNVGMSGLAPTFEPNNTELRPVWRPWPGESVQLSISRPDALPGATVTVQRGTHETTLGRRQRVSTLDLAVQSSLGEDFALALPEGAEVTALSIEQQPIPVRMDQGKTVVPLRPGAQNIKVQFRTHVPLGVRAQMEEIRLPVESANLNSVLKVPADRWVLWTCGPLRGPAVRLWGVLACAVLAALVLSRVPASPLRPLEWVLLSIGLTQVPLPAALIVVAWLFLLAWRGRHSWQSVNAAGFNLLQLVLILLTAASLMVFVGVVGEGLLGNPKTFILGNGSSSGWLRWYEPSCGATLPRPVCYSVSIWWYRLFMLAWALWLAVSLLKWLRWGWAQFSRGGFFMTWQSRRPPATPPPLKEKRAPTAPPNL